MSLDRTLSKVRRLAHVAAYIDRNLDEPLSLRRLADIACVSPYQFERMFAGYAGETPMHRVRRLRVMRAFRQLRYETHSIIDVAFRAGYASAQAFSRAFKQMTGIPPSMIPKAVGLADVPFHLERLPDLAVQYVPYEGSSDEFDLAWNDVRARAVVTHIEPEKRFSWSVYDANDLRRNSSRRVVWRAALLSDPLDSRLRGLDAGRLPAGDYAVFSIISSHPRPTFAQLAARIEAETHWEVADDFSLRRHRNLSYLCSNEDKRFDLYLPVRRRPGKSPVPVRQFCLRRDPPISVADVPKLLSVLHGVPLTPDWGGFRA